MKQAYMMVLASEDLITTDPEMAEKIAREMFDRPWKLRGPRGGRYVADGPYTMKGPVLDENDFMREATRYVYRATRDRWKYIRPKPHLAGERLVAA